MKQLIIGFIFSCVCVLANAQNVGIGTANPNTSAILELQSSNKGLLLPRVPDTSSVSNPATGLVIYSTTANAMYYFNGSNWQRTTNSGNGELWYKYQDSILVSQGKYVSINQNNEARVPMEGLSVNGNLLVQRNFISSKSSPTPAQTVTMIGNNGFQFFSSVDSVGRIFDPGGQNNNYPNGVGGNINIGSGSWGTSINFNKEDFGLAEGDTLWIGYNSFPFCRTDYELRLTNTLDAPSNLSLRTRSSTGFNSNIYFVFRSNNDGLNSKGFDISWKKNYLDPSPPILAPASFGQSLFFNSEDGSFQAGAPLRNIGRSAICIGCFEADGVASLAMAGGTSSGRRSVAIGSQSIAEGSGAVSLGGQALSFESTSIGVGNDTLTGTSRDSWVSTDPLLYVGNGYLSKSNAMVIYKNANVDINGFTRLGKLSEAAPKIKMKKFTGTSSSSQNGFTDITHGLSREKIIGVQVIMKLPGFVDLGPGSRVNSGYEYEFQILNSIIRIANLNGNSANILSKNFVVLVTYEE